MMEMLTDKALEPVRQMIDDLDVSSVFGQPVSEEGTTIIPVADLIYGFGYGYGSDDEGEGGAGGGGGGKATPRGYLRLSADGVTYHATNNDTLIAIMGMATGIWTIFWVAMTVMTLIRTLSRLRVD